MEIPDLSLRSTFSPPYYKDQTSSSPCMCKYTIYNLECGHPAEDHVDTKDCPHFQKTGVPCDRENPANRGRVSIKSEDRAGLCIKCIRRQREKAELDAMTRDEERAKQQSLAEAKEREEAAKAHEARMYKESAEEYERLRRKREQEDIEYMLQKSREEAAAVREQKERDDLARALAESCRLGPADRNVTVDEKVSSCIFELGPG
jgi:enabled protein